jgi:hypothetical protein
MTINDTLYKVQDRGFIIFIYVSYFLIIIAALGFSQLAPKYLYEMDYYVKMYVCIFLIIRFNPFRKIEFTELDRKIAFSAGLFILTTTAIAQYFDKIIAKYKNKYSQI